MFSTSMAIIKRALVVAAWGATLIAQQVSAADASASPGSTADVAAVWVTGTVEEVDGTCSHHDNGSDSAVTRSAFTCTQTSTSSDPRLTGTVTKSWNEDTYLTDEGPISVGIDTLYVRNDDGGWSCSDGYVAKGASPGTEPLTKSTFTCIGEGGYEGLTAVLVSEQVAGAFTGDFAGLLFPGALPAVPEA